MLTHAQKVKLILSSRQPMAPKPKSFTRPMGQVKGGKGGDDIPAMLSGPSAPGQPGEFVMNKGAVLNLGLDFLTHQNLRGLGHFNNYQLNAPSADQTVPASAPKNSQGVAMLQEGSGDLPARFDPRVGHYVNYDPSIEPEFLPGTDAPYTSSDSGHPTYHDPIWGDLTTIGEHYDPSGMVEIPTEQPAAQPDSNNTQPSDSKTEPYYGTPPSFSTPPMPGVPPPSLSNTFYPQRSGFDILPGGNIGGPGGRNDFGRYINPKNRLSPSGAGAIVDDTRSWNPPGMSRWQNIQQILNTQQAGSWTPTLGTPNLRTSSPRNQM